MILNLYVYVFPVFEMFSANIGSNILFSALCYSSCTSKAPMVQLLELSEMVLLAKNNAYLFLRSICKSEVEAWLSWILCFRGSPACSLGADQI